MKKHMELIVQFKLVWGLIFTAAIILYTTINMLMGKTTMEYIVIWQFVGVTMVLCLIHYMIFGEFILKTASTKFKLFIHFSLCYITMLISGIAANLIDLAKPIHLIIFTCGYTFIYMQISLSFYIYHKATGEELNKKLAAYKKDKNEI